MYTHATQLRDGDSALTPRDATAVVKPFGFVARAVPLGFFLNAGGDDLMLVRLDGEIVPYAHDAQAFLAATALRNVIAKGGK